MVETTARRSVAVRVAMCALAAATACAVGLVMSTPAEAAPKATTQVKVLKAKKFKKAKQNKVAGTAKDSAKAIAAVKISKSGSVKGDVKYTLYAKGKTFKNKKNGAVAGNGKKAGRAISIKLTGNLKKSYNVYYQAYIKGFGWTAWGSNGAKVGSTAKDAAKAHDMTAIKVQILAKKKAAPVAKNVGDVYISGLCKKGSNKLDKALSYVSKTALRYRATGRSQIKTSSKFTEARQSDELVAAFEEGAGDCYTFTSVGTAVAKKLGYTAHAAAGTYTSAKTGAVQPYSWTVVDQDGQDIIYDVTNGRLALDAENEVYPLFAELA